MMTPLTYRVAASCFEAEATQDMEQRRELLYAHLLELLNTQGPDLVVLPELGIAHGMQGEAHWSAEPVDGRTISIVSKLAANTKTNICMPILENDNDTYYNTAVYVDRKGDLAGIYRKQVLTTAETERGIRPGKPNQPPVVLEQLRIGTAICFDENFPDQIWHWIATGVDLLVFPSYTFAGELMRNWAVNCGVPLICAFPWESVIYDRDGSLLAKAGSLTTTVRFGNHPDWIACTLNLHSRIYHLDGNQKRLKNLIARYGKSVDVRLMERDGRIMITARADNIDLDQVERELEWVPLQEYLRTSRKLSMQNNHEN